MGHRWTHTIPLILLWGATNWVPTGADAQEPHRFGESVALGSDASLVVTKRDVGEVRSRSRSQFPSEFPSADQNVVAFEFRYGGSGVYSFWTDRTDPSRSDIVALCGTVRVNILKLGSGTFDSPNAYSFGTPGAPQGKDGRWASIVAGGAPPGIVLFSLPADCTRKRTRLLVALDYKLGGKTTKHQLLFTEPSEAGPKKKP